MKKLIVTILSFLYLGLASGVVVNLHYCMGELSSVEYGYDEHSRCENCGMAEKEGCCSTESKLVKLQDSHQLAKADWLVNKFISAFSFSHNDVSFDYLYITSFSAQEYHSPPDHRLNALYLHTSIFRI